MGPIAGGTPGTNSLDLAAKLGDRVGGIFIRDVFEWMQVVFLLKAAGHTNFTQGLTSTRLRENLLIVGPPAIGKSFAGKLFIPKCMGALPISKMSAAGPHRPPVVTQLDGGSVTVEALRGGATSEGRPIPPLILLSDILFCSDLPSFLRTGEARTRGLTFLLMVAEDGEQDVYLVKCEEMDREEWVKFREWAASKNIRGLYVIDEPRRGFRIESDVPLIMCCTHEELRSGEKSLEKVAPGFLSRLVILEHIPTDDEVEEAWMREPRDVDVSPLLRENETIWRTPILQVPFPPMDLFQAISTWVLSEARDIARENDKPLYMAINQRMKAHIARLMAASAIARTFAVREPGDTSPVETLNYTSADADFARRMMNTSLTFASDRITKETGESKDDVGRRDSGTAHVSIYLDFLRTLKEPWPVQVSYRAFKGYCTHKRTKSPKTVANYLTALKEAAIIKRRHAADEMSNDPEFLRANGFVEPVEDEPDVPGDGGGAGEFVEHVELVGRVEHMEQYEV